MLVRKATVNTVLGTGVVLGVALNPFLGGKSAIIFLVFGLSFFLFQFRRSVANCLYQWPLFMFPMWATVTTLWSFNPSITLRSGIQLLLTYAFCVAVVTILDYKKTLTVMAGCYLLALLSVFVMSNTVTIFETGQVVRIGVLGSKNNVSGVGVAAIASSMMLLCLPSARIGQKLMAAGIILVGIAVILQARSLGTFVALCGCSGVGIYLWFVSSKIKTSNLKPIFVYIPLALAAFALLTIVLFWSYPGYVAFMDGIGKDPTITGRTFIWSIGTQIIDQNMMGGIGYNSYWTDRNPGAVLLWEKGHRAIGSPYGFHNTYIHAGVETGLPGMLIILGLAFYMMKRIVHLTRNTMHAYEAVAVAYALFLIAKSFFEVYFSGIFSADTMMFCFIWDVLSRRLDPRRLDPGQRQSALASDDLSQTTATP